MARLWATGRYGFSLPKKVEITVPDGRTWTFFYYNRKAGLRSEVTNRTIVRMAITQFLACGGDPPAEPAEIDDGVEPFDGVLTQVRAPAPPASLRVRPGRGHARNNRTAQGASDGAATGPG